MLNTWRFISSLCPTPVVMVLRSGELQVGDWLDPVPRPCCSLIVLVSFILWHLKWFSHAYVWCISISPLNSHTHSQRARAEMAQGIMALRRVVFCFFFFFSFLVTREAGSHALWEIPANNVGFLSLWFLHPMAYYKVVTYGYQGRNLTLLWWW